MIYLTYNYKVKRNYDLDSVVSKFKDSNLIQGIRINLCQYKKTEIIKNLNAFLIELKKYANDLEILVDLPYPYNKIRISRTTLRDEEVIEGEKYKIIYDSHADNDVLNSIYINKSSIVKCNSDIVYYADGDTAFKILSETSEFMDVIALKTCKIYPNKSLSIGLSKGSSQIVYDILNILYDNNVKFSFLLSFVSNYLDVLAIRQLCNMPVKIISKIETKEACYNYKKIVDYSDGVVIARGDMALYYNLNDIYWMTKKIIMYSNLKNKRTFLATDILLSLENRIVPNRADIFDISNMVDLGCTDFILRNHPQSALNKAETIDAILKRKQTNVGDYYGY